MKADLVDLNFSDLYLRLDKDGQAIYRIGPNNEGKSGLAAVPDGHDSDLAAVRNAFNADGTNSGTVTYDEITLRFVRMPTVEDQVWAAIRRIPLSPPTLDELGLHPDAVTMMRGFAARRGLVLIGGATGAGKTTTVFGALHDYLKIRGGVAITLEDPPELLLQGPVGAGICFQMGISETYTWQMAVMAALRSRPRYILIGEIRTPEAAQQALIASQSGHLVLTTAHGGSVEEAVETIIGLAEVRLGEQAARRLMAGNLLAAIHQWMGHCGPNLEVVQTKSGGTRAQDPVRSGIIDNRPDVLRQNLVKFTAPPPRAAAAE